MPTDPGFLAYVLEQLDGVGNVTSRAMFGGHGIYESGAIFAIVSSDSTLYFKVDDETRPRFEATESHQFARMPYWSVPADVLDNSDMLKVWTSDAIAVGHATAKAKKKR